MAGHKAVKSNFPTIPNELFENGDLLEGETPLEAALTTGHDKKAKSSKTPNVAIATTSKFRASVGIDKAGHDSSSVSKCQSDKKPLLDLGGKKANKTPLTVKAGILQNPLPPKGNKVAGGGGRRVPTLVPK